MSEEQIVRHCAPTLAGIKTGSLFSCGFKDKEQLVSDIRALNQRLVPKGLCVLPLRYSKDRALIYVFRPVGLRQDLSCGKARSLLQATGYQSGKAEQCIIELIRRLNTRESFPHEIGLFLGYPPEDVSGFIENRSRNFKCVGCWKVYGDEEKARKQFSQFDQCTNCYCRQFHSGIGIDRLTVAV